MSYTKGPWFLLQTDGADFTAISTRDKLPLSEWHKNKDGSPKLDTMDLDNEVLGSSEWLRATEEDLKLMASAPKLYEALKNSQKIIQMFLPNIDRCFGIDFQLLNETGIEINSILTKLKEIE